MLTQEQAINLYNSHWWIGVGHEALATFQLYEERLCMPFSLFHEAVEKTLGRPVFANEFGTNWEGLKKELRGEAPAPSFADILAIIPEDKRVLAVVDK